MKKLLLSTLALLTINAYASSKETWLCLGNMTVDNMYLSVKDNDSPASNSMWDGGDARPSSLNGKIIPGLGLSSHICQRIEINTSNKQNKLSHGMYMFYLGVRRENNPKTYWTLIGLNADKSYYWGVVNDPTGGVITTDEWRSEYREPVNYYASDYSNIIGQNISSTFMASPTKCDSGRNNCSHLTIRTPPK